MNIILFYPDIPRKIQEKDSFLNNNYPSLGVNYLASVLRHNKHNVTVYDIFFHYISNDCQPSLDFTSSVKKLLQNFIPQIVGISFLTPSRRESLQVARLIKKIAPGTIVVAGGAHASVMHRQLLLNYPEIDFVVIGEGEITFEELVKSIETKTDLHNVKGIAFRENIGRDKQIVVTPPRPLINDLDLVPFPDYKQYLQFMPRNKLHTAAIVTARGCAYGKCKFCASRSLWPNCRSRSVKNVVDEIEILIKEYGVENIHIHDDTFTYFPERATKIFKEIVKRKLKVILDFKTIFSKITPELLYWFKKAGGRSIFYGLESGSERLRNLMGKPQITNESIEFIVETTKKAGVKVGLFVMFGYPGETINDIKETIEILKKLDPDRVRCTLTKVYPGTQLYQYAKERNLISDEYWLKEDFDHRYFVFLSEEEIAQVKEYDLLFKEQLNRSEIWREYDDQDIPY
jgi:anaerobic magnesium-protoporphyrin IX monomethyl ester cyclase